MIVPHNEHSLSKNKLIKHQIKKYNMKKYTTLIVLKNYIKIHETVYSSDFLVYGMAINVIVEVIMEDMVHRTHVQCHVSKIQRYFVALMKLLMFTLLGKKVKISSLVQCLRIYQIVLFYHYNCRTKSSTGSGNN